jgi:hypothetical protein
MTSVPVCAENVVRIDLMSESQRRPHGREAASIATMIDESGYGFAAPRHGQRFNDWEQEQCGKLALPEVDGRTTTIRACDIRRLRNEIVLHLIQVRG